MATRHPGHYALVQYCPDAARQEAANLGVILSVPSLGFLEATLSRSVTRALSLFAGTPPPARRLHEAMQALQSRLSLDHHRLISEGGLEALSISLGNEIRVAAPRPLVVEDPRLELQQLFDELVAHHRAPTEDTPPRGLQELEAAFHEARFASKVRFDVPLMIPVIDREWVAPFVYRNGVDNLVLPERFSSQEGQAWRMAEAHAAVGRLLHDGQVGQLVVFGELSPKLAPALEARFARLFKQFDARFVHSANYLSFIEEVENTAH